MPDVYEAVIRPVVTEKSSAAYSQRKEYAFRVHPEANKHQVRDAISSMFGVRVLKVRTMVQPSKKKTMGRSTGRRAKWKKAYVTLHPDDSIDIFEG
jgi:large subunit ribosomal protein L23